jgi:hypothetical protein
MGDVFLSNSGKRLQHVDDGHWTAMEGGRRNGNLMAIDGLMARTAMDDATATQRKWMMDGNGQQLTAQWRLNSDGLDGGGWCDGDWWTKMDGLTAMGRNGRLIDSDGWWTAINGDGRRGGHSTEKDLTAMDRKGRLDGD